MVHGGRSIVSGIRRQPRFRTSCACAGLQFRQALARIRTPHRSGRRAQSPVPYPGRRSSRPVPRTAQRSGTIPPPTVVTEPLCAAWIGWRTHGYWPVPVTFLRWDCECSTFAIQAVRQKWPTTNRRLDVPKVVPGRCFFVLTRKAGIPPDQSADSVITFPKFHANGEENPGPPVWGTDFRSCGFRIDSRERIRLSLRTKPSRCSDAAVVMAERIETSSP